MKGKNAVGVSFPGDGKETIQERLKGLMKGRSLRQVSFDWGLPYSTINNYFAKGTMPGVDVLVAVSNIEQVSLEWLILGTCQAQETEDQSNTHEQAIVSPIDEESDYIVKIISMLDQESRKKLLKVLLMKGAEAVLLLTNETNLKLMQLPEREKMAMMKLCDNTNPEVAKILQQLADLGGEQSNDPVTKKAV
ncbi:hypothetical protein [Limnobaculum xujianqingii]|uniref:hypothetical protein n=1 Tax=Limnobaculum xujianqingii TaxID=2738837 RepID=UPI0011273796|nr:hypothetical protein [Limnobaculum xujianqingii]